MNNYPNLQHAHQQIQQLQTMIDHHQITLAGLQANTGIIISNLFNDLQPKANYTKDGALIDDMDTLMTLNENQDADKIVQMFKTIKNDLEGLLDEDKLSSNQS